MGDFAQTASEEADIAGAGVEEEAVAEDLHRLGGADAVAAVVAGGEDDQVPEAFDGAVALSLLAQPSAERGAVQPAPLRFAHAPHGEQGAAKVEPFDQAEVGIGEDG